MMRAWDSDDKFFVLVLAAAVICQTATNKNFVGATANATVALFAQTLNASAPGSQRKPVQTVRRSSPVWAGTVAFFKAAAAKIVARAPVKPVPARKSSTLSFVHRSWHTSPPKPKTAAPKPWRIGFDRVHWPWTRRTRTSTLSLPTDPRLAEAAESPRS
jgi:hypothetical protein